MRDTLAMLASSSVRSKAPARTKSAAPYEVKRSKIQGRGVFATRAIPKGTRLLEYTGARITHDEASDRYDDGAMERHHTFLFQIDEKVVIDGADGGNEARFINHSCAPNCESILEEDQVFIETIRAIEKGEELTYDYLYVVDANDEVDAAMLELYACGCGTAACRGTILDLSNHPLGKGSKRKAKSRKSPARPKAPGSKSSTSPRGDVSRAPSRAKRSKRPKRASRKTRTSKR